MDIGFIGLGLMGRPMALHLAEAGHRLHLWARRPASLTPFAGTLAVAHDSPAEMAAASEVVFTMVADAPDVREVILGANGVADGARAGAIIVDMSTIAPAAAQDIGRQLAARQLHFLDAPVSGGEVGAIQATLTIMVGGEEAAFARVRPLLACLGKSVTLIGASGAGQVAKACNQILTGVTVAAVAEALHFAQRSGVDAARVREALLGGFAYSRILENHGQRMLDGNFAPGFKAWMHRKDLRIVLEEAQRLDLMLPNSAATAQMFNAVVGCGFGEEDSISVLKVLGRLSQA
jgi:2-hydroxy-3-oxopropionate reductase